MTLRDTFDAIYRDNRWNGVESMSGPGSGAAATNRVRSALVELAAELRVESVLDVGCGDGWWMPDLPGYVGVDVSEEAIAAARRNHPERLYLAGTLHDGWGLPAFDLVIVRDALQHLPWQDGLDLLRAIRATRSRFLLASTYLGGLNVPIEPGDCYDVNLTAPPFDMPEPIRLIFDGYSYHETEEVRDVRKHLGLWQL